MSGVTADNKNAAPSLRRSRLWRALPVFVPLSSRPKFPPTGQAAVTDRPDPRANVYPRRWGNKSARGRGRGCILGLWSGFLANFRPQVDSVKISFILEGFVYVRVVFTVLSRPTTWK